MTEKRLTRADLDHLEYALHDFNRHGYYGAYNRFMKRHEKLMAWVKEQRRAARRRKTT